VISPALVPILISFIVAISILFMLIRPRNVPRFTGSAPE